MLNRLLKLAYIGLMGLYFINQVRAAHASNQGNVFENRLCYCQNNVLMMLATIAWQHLQKEGVVE